MWWPKLWLANSDPEQKGGCAHAEVHREFFDGASRRDRNPDVEHDERHVADDRPERAWGRYECSRTQWFGDGCSELHDNLYRNGDWIGRYDQGAVENYCIRNRSFDFADRFAKLHRSRRKLDAELEFDERHLGEH
jgi:hypothetical protein